MSMTKEEVDEVMEIFNILWRYDHGGASRHPQAQSPRGALHTAARVWYYKKLKELGLLEES